ncbi:MAG: hypothetical protein AAF919_16675 [Pseudomonadota bacterium]
MVSRMRALVLFVLTASLAACGAPEPDRRAQAIAATFPDLADRQGIYLAERTGRRTIRVAWDTARLTRPEVEWRVSGQCQRLDPALDGRTETRRAKTTTTRLPDGRIARLRDETFTCLRR